jgi:hypothetical protein
MRESNYGSMVTDSMTVQPGKESRTVIQRIAAFAVAAESDRLDVEIRQLLKRNILDSLGCAIASLPGGPFRQMGEQLEEYRAPGRCTLIGRGKTSVGQAALLNSGLVRYVDLLDSYMAHGGLCHPSDNFGAVLAAAEYVAASSSCWRSRWRTKFNVGLPLLSALCRGVSITGLNLQCRWPGPWDGSLDSLPAKLPTPSRFRRSTMCLLPVCTSSRNCNGRDFRLE